MVVGEQGRAQGELEEQGGGGLVEVDAGGQGAQVAHRETAAAQDPRAQGIGVVEQLVDQGDELGGRGGCGPVDVVGVVARGCRGLLARLGVQAAAADGQPHLARHDDVLGVEGGQETGVDERGDGPAGASLRVAGDGGRGTVRGDVAQDLALLGGEVGEGRRQVEGQRVTEGRGARAEPRGVRAEDVGDGAGQDRAVGERHSRAAAVRSSTRVAASCSSTPTKGRWSPGPSSR